MRIGNTSFNVEAVKQMTVKEFVSSYSMLLRGIEASDAYYLITGKSRPKPKKKKADELEGKND